MAIEMIRRVCIEDLGNGTCKDRLTGQACMHAIASEKASGAGQLRPHVGCEGDDDAEVVKKHNP